MQNSRRNTTKYLLPEVISCVKTDDLILIQYVLTDCTTVSLEGTETSVFYYGKELQHTKPYNKTQYLQN